MNQINKILWIGLFLFVLFVITFEVKADDIYTKVKRAAILFVYESGKNAPVKIVAESEKWEHKQNLISYSMEYIIQNGTGGRRILVQSWAKKNKEGLWKISSSTHEVNPDTDIKLKVVPK
jgi:SH3-like domain-containing protein